MPVESTVVDGAFYTYDEQSYVPPYTQAYTTWTNYTYTSYSRTYNAVQRRVKPNPLTDTALAQQKTIRMKLAHIPFRDLYIQRNTILKKDVWRQVKGNIGKYTDVAPEPPWQSDVLDYVAKKRVNLGSSLAEYRDTVGMFKSFAEAMHTGYQTIKGRAPRHLEITPCTVAAADLAYAFGVKPLVEDVFSATEELALRLGGPVMIPYSYTSSRTSSVNKPNFSAGGGLGSPTWVNVSAKHRKSDYVKILIGLKPTVGSFNLGNPAIWAWELIPYSFVVDWGIDVGSWLQRLDTFTSILSIKGTRTRREVYAHYGKIRCTNLSGASIMSSQHKYSEKSHQRFLQNSIPLPSLPRWEPSASWTKLRRAMALLVVAESGRKVDDIVKSGYIHGRSNKCGGAVKKPRRQKRPRAI
jgi:hypothetical protein